MHKVAKELNEKIKETTCAKQYFALKQEINNNSYLMTLLETITKTQKELQAALKNNDLVTYQNKIKYLELLKEDFSKHPLINNYLATKHDLFELLEQLVNILSVD